MPEKESPRLVTWLLIFLYFIFIYNNGAKLLTLPYTDFPSFYYGARLVFVEKHSPYDEKRLKDAANAMEPPKMFEAPRRIYPYLYPPPSLLMFYPLAKLHVGTAKLAILALNHVCLLFVIFAVLVPIAGFKSRELTTHLLPAFLAIYFFFSAGTLGTIALGQVNLFVMALLCVAWLGVLYDWPAWAIGVPLGIASVFKIYPVLFLALLVIRRRYWAAAATLGVLLAVCGASYLVLPHAFWHEWKTNVLPTGGYLKAPLGVFPPTLAGNFGIAGFMSRLFLPPVLGMEANLPPPGPALIHHEALGRLLTYAVVAAACLATFAFAFMSSRLNDSSPVARKRRINIEFSAFLVLTFLVAPLAWEHHLVYVTPALVIALLIVLRDRPELSGGWLPTGILLIACLLGWPLAFGKLPLPRVAQILIVSVKFYAVVALWLFLFAQFARRSPGGDMVADGSNDMRQ